MKSIVSIVLILVISLGMIVLPKAETVQAASDAWEWQGPLSEGKHIYGIWGSSASDIFAVGQSGVILHYDGSDWATMDSGTSTDLFGIWGTSASDVFVVGNTATILHYNGSGWSAVASGLPQSSEYNLFCIWGSSSTDIYAGSSGGKIIHYDGSDWTSGGTGIGGIILDIWGTSATDVFATSSWGNILHYNGTDWSEMDSPLTPGSNQNLYGVWGSSSSDVFAVGRNSVALHYDGTGWTQMDTSAISNIILQSVWGSGSGDVFAVGNYGTVIHYNGVSWTAMPSTLKLYIYDVWGSSGSNVLAVGDYGAIIRYNGTSWLPASGGAAPEFLLGAWGSSADNVYTVGTGNAVLNYDGTGWSAVDTGTASSQLNDVWGSSADDIFIVGLDGLILHWDGSIWTQMTSGTTDHLFAVWGTTWNDVHAIGYEKTMLHYDGSIWSNVGPGFGFGVLHGLWGSAVDDAWATGAAGRIYHYTGLQPPGTSSWTQVVTGLGGNYNGVWGSAADDIFAVGDWGKIVHYDGIDWTDMTSNTSDHLHGVWGTSSTDVYAVGESGLYAGNIHHYDGTGWTQVDTGLGTLGSNSYRDIWGASSAAIFVVGSHGVILHYSNESGSTVAPVVTNSVGATDITTSSARLNGEITGTGGENPSVHIYWGLTDGATTPGSWDNDIELGVLPEGTFYSDISALTPDTPYYYRCYAENLGGSAWASSTGSFTTYTLPTEVWVDDVTDPDEDGTQAHPYDSIQEGIDNAAAGGTVHVLAGTYNEHITLRDGVDVVGEGGSASTIIDGGGSGRVVTASSIGSGTSLEGFTIRNGSISDGGGGMYNSSSSPTLTDCTFESNAADWGGGMFNYYSSPVLTNCRFNSNNTHTADMGQNYGGGMYNDNSSPVSTNCTFETNTALTYGGAMYNLESSPELTGCTFTGNSAETGGGMYNETSSPTITGCSFDINTTSGGNGGGMYSNDNSSLTITGCTFTGNSAGYGGGVHSYLSSHIVTNCTFTGNSAVNGAGIYNENSASVVTNCILRDGGNEIFDAWTTSTVTYCDVQGGYTGNGNFDLDPLFVGGGDLHLQSQQGHWTGSGWVTDDQTSPCIDTGHPDSAYDNEPAPNGGRINMGAYGNTAQASKTTENVPPTVTSTLPTDGATEMPVDTNIEVLFSRAMNTASVEGAFSLDPPAAAGFSWNTAETVMTVIPGAGLAYDTSYTVTIGTGARDQTGNALAAPYIWSFTTRDNTVTFPDSSLEAVIRAATGISEPEPIRTTDLEGLTELDGSSQGIVDLTGLEYCINLQTLNLDDNSITDISPLWQMTGLQELSLKQNDIDNIAALYGLSNLWALYLDQNDIVDLQPLTLMTGLYLLSIDLNDISDISMLGSLTSLQGFSFRYNSVVDIQALAGLTGLQGLYFSYNDIVDISALSGLTGLQYLYADNNRIADVSPLVANAGIGSGDMVFLHDNPLSAGSLYVHIPALEARDADVYPGDVVVDFPDDSLESVIRTVIGKPAGDIYHTDLTFTSLDGSSQGIADLAGLEYCVNLQELNLDNNDIVDISPLVDSTGVGPGDSVSLLNNPLSADSLYVCIPALEARGVSVSYDEQTVSVITGAATEITLDSATVNGTLESPGAHVSMDVSFEWGEASGGPYTGTTPETLYGSDNFSFELTGLTSDTTYYYRAKAAGVMDCYGDEEEFTTAKMPPAVTTNQATGITDMTATLRGTMDGRGDYSSVNVSFEWGTEPGVYTVNTTSAHMTDTGDFSFELIGLTPATPYFFRAKAEADGIIVYGDEQSFVTYLLPIEVWVDDDWAGLSPGEPVDGYIFGYNAFADIQAGIAGVEDIVGTVNVNDGTYTVSMEVVVEKSITVRSVNGPGVTTVETTAVMPPVFVLWADHVTITGFTFAGHPDDMCGIYLADAASCNISDCTITGFVYGMYLVNSSNTRVKNSVIRDSEIGIWIITSDGNSLLNNVIRDNAEGIVISDSDNNMVAGNDILANISSTLPPRRSGIHLDGTSSGNIIHFNNFAGNSLYGVFNENAPTVYARNNWWGDADGPGGEGPGTGDAVNEYVDYIPWLGVSVGDCTSEDIIFGTVDATGEADTEVAVEGSGTVTVAKYDGNPGSGFSGDIGKYVDVFFEGQANEVEIRLYYTDAEISGKVESSLVLYWWNGSTWAACSNSGVNTTDIGDYSGYIWAIIDNNTTPSLSELNGTPFGSVADDAPTPPETPAAPVVPSGGGGGVSGVTPILNLVNTEGMLMQDVTGWSPDRKVWITMQSGTYCLSSTGSLISSVSIRALTSAETPPTSPPDTVPVCLYYRLTPNGATFSPPATLNFKYDTADLQGASPNSLTIALWDPVGNEWILQGGTVDTINHIISVPLSHFSLYTVMAGTQPAELSPGGLTVTPSEVEEGDEVTVGMTITNSGDRAGTWEAVLRVNNSVEQTKTVTIEGRDSATVSFTVTAGTTGDYTVSIGDAAGEFTVLAPEPEQEAEGTPASFSVSEVSVSPDEVGPGEETVVSAVVTNTGGTEGSYTVVLSVDGVEEEIRDVTVGPGASEYLAFAVSRGEEGSYDVDCNGVSSSFTVVAPQPELEEPVEALPEGPTTNWGLIIGIIAAVVVIAGLSLYVINRRKKVQQN